jgi:hypothetical protein
MAIYYYNGFYKNPKSLKIGILASNNQAGLLPYYSRLNVYGYSSEGQVGPGILSFETGYNYSKDDGPARGATV